METIGTLQTRCPRSAPRANQAANNWYTPCRTRQLRLLQCQHRDAGVRCRQRSPNAIPAEPWKLHRRLKIVHDTTTVGGALSPEFSSQLWRVVNRYGCPPTTYAKMLTDRRNLSDTGAVNSTSSKRDSRIYMRHARQFPNWTRDERYITRIGTSAPVSVFHSYARKRHATTFLGSSDWNRMFTLTEYKTPSNCLFC